MAADPAAIDDVAHCLDLVANGVAAIGDDLDRAVRITTWTGRGADRFRRAVTDQSARLRAEAADLHAAAADVRRVGESTRRELAVLHSLEARVHDAFLAAARTAAATGSPLPWTAWPWRPDRLPERSSPAWHAAAAFLRGHGMLP